MIRQGASVKAVQKQLGHATANITLDTYGRWRSRRSAGWLRVSEGDLNPHAL
jgi:integrase